jgi:hypothetical protein
MLAVDASKQPPRGRLSCITVIAGITLVLIGLYFLTLIKSLLVTEQPVRVAQALGELRILQTVLSTYNIDHLRYMPARSLGPWLTTPIPYMNFLASDPYSKEQHGTPASWIRYHSDGTNYLIWSVGPDGVSQITVEDEVTSDLAALVPMPYDSSNGSKSLGDIWRSNIGSEADEPTPLRDMPEVLCP